MKLKVDKRRNFQTTNLLICELLVTSEKCHIYKLSEYVFYRKEYTLWVCTKLYKNGIPYENALTKLRSWDIFWWKQPETVHKK